MPRYLYRCADCGAEHRVEAKMSDPPLPVCPDCRGAVRKVPVSTGAPVLKGGGWAKDGYGK